MPQMISRKTKEDLDSWKSTYEVRLMETDYGKDLVVNCSTDNMSS